MLKDLCDLQLNSLHMAFALFAFLLYLVTNCIMLFRSVEVNIALYIPAYKTPVESVNSR